MTASLLADAVDQLPATPTGNPITTGNPATNTTLFDEDKQVYIVRLPGQSESSVVVRYAAAPSSRTAHDAIGAVQGIGRTISTSMSNAQMAFHWATAAIGGVPARTDDHPSTPELVGE